MIIMKFGGTSVKDAPTIINSVNIVKSRYPKAWVVVSALSGVTNLLVEICDNLKLGNNNKIKMLSNELRVKHIDLSNELKLTDTQVYINNYLDRLFMIFEAINVLGELTAKSIDLILSTGEILSSKIIAEYSQKIGMNSIHCNSVDIIKTDSNFNSAEIDLINTKVNIDRFIHQNSTKDYIISGGFIGSDSENNITTLGRGGSDFTASIISWALKSEKLEIWTDVNGIMTTDPRIVRNAKLLTQVSYQEASELSYFGAKVLHPKTIFPAISENIPVYVLNSFNPNCEGTLITNESKSKNIIKSIAFRRKITLINIISNRMLGAFGFLSKVFEVFNKNKTSVDLVSTSEVSISLTIENEINLKLIQKELSEFSSIEIFTNQAIIAAIGSGIRDTSGIAARFFTTLKGINVSLITFGASEVNLSVVVNDSDLEAAVKLLHIEFFDKNDNEIYFREII